MILPRQTLSTLLVTASLVLGSVAVMTPAPASAAPAGCPVRGLGCTYENNNYGGGNINFYEYVRNFESVGYWARTFHTRTNDAGSSGFNNGQSGMAARWYKHANYTGPYIHADKGKGVNFSAKGLNDQISSACFRAYC
ncbi:MULTISPECIES: peptidase inhibitor family I36 protein [Frigoribacterium]|uniref:peptidase inhibitor family I36 protein n=1 Tax=Frigoribacterium TaxID=96492 RepID=UPI001784F8C8|nr:MULTISPECIES: peptidase inhibitor family I36 protein [Frigoribacterium]MBD8704611.1 peptidase inhibitor family I36 protein [Frigoribacterium sp. CFBP 13712]MCJ0701597.1 peptidase inhibitor family I36 protein [Frigoribacterium faeni]MDY0892376.1 peptidase inhibitor family I36 protein [Frigoribacterium sp. CFBP9030]